GLEGGCAQGHRRLASGMAALPDRSSGTADGFQGGHDTPAQGGILGQPSWNSGAAAPEKRENPSIQAVDGLARRKRGGSSSSETTASTPLGQRIRGVVQHAGRRTS